MGKAGRWELEASGHIVSTSGRGEMNVRVELTFSFVYRQGCQPVDQGWPHLVWGFLDHFTLSGNALRGTFIDFLN